MMLCRQDKSRLARNVSILHAKILNFFNALFFIVDAIAERKKELAKEAEEVAANIAEHKELEEQNQKTMRQKNKAHQQNLLDQMKYQEMIKKKEEQELQDDLELAQREEYLHQIRVRQAVLNPDLKKIHPRRLIELPGPP